MPLFVDINFMTFSGRLAPTDVHVASPQRRCTTREVAAGVELVHGDNDVHGLGDADSPDTFQVLRCLPPQVTVTQRKGAQVLFQAAAG